MKKIVSVFILMLIFSINQANAEGFIDEIKKDFNDVTQNLFRNKEAVTQNQKNRNGYDDSIRIEDEIAKINARRDKELAPIKKQIDEKNALMKQTLTNSSLTMSQKKAKMSLIQKEINTLKAQKTNIEDKYAKEVREMRAIY